MKRLEETSVVSVRDRQLLSALKQLVLERLPSARVFLFGSVARGEHNAESDYDVLVLTDSHLTHQEEKGLDDAIYGFELAHAVVVSTVLHTKEEWGTTVYQSMPFHQRLEQDAILL